MIEDYFCVKRPVESGNEEMKEKRDEREKGERDEREKGERDEREKGERDERGKGERDGQLVQKKNIIRRSSLVQDLDQNTD